MTFITSLFLKKTSPEGIPLSALVFQSLVVRKKKSYTKSFSHSGKGDVCMQARQFFYRFVLVNRHGWQVIYA